MPKKEHFRPNWYEDVTPAGTYRSLIKWGDPAGIKHPNSGLVRLIMDKFHLTEADLSAPINLSLEPVEDNLPCRLPAEHLAFFRDLCGEENVRTDAYARITLVRQRHARRASAASKNRGKPTRNCGLLAAAMKLSALWLMREHRIPVTVFGGGSTVTRGWKTLAASAWT